MAQVFADLQEGLFMKRDAGEEAVMSLPSFTRAITSCFHPDTWPPPDPEQAHPEVSLQEGGFLIGLGEHTPGDTLVAGSIDISYADKLQADEPGVLEIRLSFNDKERQSHDISGFAFLSNWSGLRHETPVDIDWRQIWHNGELMDQVSFMAFMSNLLLNSVVVDSEAEILQRALICDKWVKEQGLPPGSEVPDGIAYNEADLCGYLTPANRL